MIRAIITLMVLVSTTFAATSKDMAARMDAVNETVAAMSVGSMSVDVRFRSCGQTNAYYSPRNDTLTMCLETLELPLEVVRFFTAHEMGHAIIDQLNIPIPGSEEAAADELGAVAMGVLDHPDAILQMAVFFTAHDDGGEDVEDDHQSAAKRAAVLICLGDGSVEDAVRFDCRKRYLDAVSVWVRLIGAFGGE